MYNKDGIMTVKCPVCGSDTKQKYNIGAKIFKCKSCSLMFAESISYTPEKEEELDTGSWYENINELRTRNYRYIVSSIKELNIGNYGLEVGSSMGWFLEICKENGIDCVGIEPENSVYAKSHDSGHNVFHGFFPDDLPESVNNVDFIIYNDVFEHIPDINHAMKSSLDVLRKEGYLIINLPMSTGIFYKLAIMFNFIGLKRFLERLWQIHFYTPHFYYHSIKSMSALCEKYDLEMVKYHRLDVVGQQDIEYRIKIDQYLSKFSGFFSLIFKIFMPIIKKMPEDIGVFYLRKKC